MRDSIFGSWKGYQRRFIPGATQCAALDSYTEVVEMDLWWLREIIAAANGIGYEPCL